MSDAQESVEKILLASGSTASVAKMMHDLEQVGVSLGLIERVGKKHQEKKVIDLLSSDGQILLPELYLGVSDNLRIELYVQSECGKKTEVFGLLESKFAKLSFLFVQDFFQEEHLEFLRAWRHMQEQSKDVLFLGPFVPKIEKQALINGELLVGKSQVSPLLALCQKMVDQTPQWVIEGLQKMEQHYYQKEALACTKKASPKALHF